ncbi:MAG: glycosyltransferase family 2 protein [Thermoleophilaceae bacterium]
MPVHNGSSTLDRALRSLLEQHRRDFGLIVVDDRSSDSSAEVAEAWAARDPRIVFSRNERRLGLIGNWRRCFSLARTLFPDAEYFAWASDHDCWEAEWLGTLVGALDAGPHSVVLAFPRPYGVGRHGPVVSPAGVDTTDVEEPGQRLRMMSGATSAGYMVYGLFRVHPLERAGPFPCVSMPDRLLLMRLSLYGAFVQADEILWHRYVVERPSLSAHQRSTLFLDGAPASAHLPAWLVHGLVLLWELGIRGAGRPQVGRARGAKYSGLHLWDHFGRRVGGRLRRRRRAFRRFRRPWIRRMQKAPRRMRRRVLRVTGMIGRYLR